MHYHKELFVTRVNLAGHVASVSELPEKKRGRPLLVGEDIEDQVKEYIREIRASGRVVNTAITLAAAKSIVFGKDANMLAENGGYLDLTRDWAK